MMITMSAIANSCDSLDLNKLFLTGNWIVTKREGNKVKLFISEDDYDSGTQIAEYFDLNDTTDVSLKKHDKTKKPKFYLFNSHNYQRLYVKDYLRAEKCGCMLYKFHNRQFCYVQFIGKIEAVVRFTSTLCVIRVTDNTASIQCVFFEDDFRELKTELKRPENETEPSQMDYGNHKTKNLFQKANMLSRKINYLKELVPTEYEELLPGKIAKITGMLRDFDEERNVIVKQFMFIPKERQTTVLENHMNELKFLYKTFGYSESNQEITD